MLYLLMGQLSQQTYSFISINYTLRKNPIKLIVFLFFIEESTSL